MGLTEDSEFSSKCSRKADPSQQVTGSLATPVSFPGLLLSLKRTKFIPAPGCLYFLSLSGQLPGPNTDDAFL